MTPTEDDLRRDLAADLALCEVLPPGWQVGTAVHEWKGKYYASLPPRAGAGEAGADAARILAMRYGWPAAIRRALAAEAECARLQAIITGLTDRVAAQSDLLTRRAEK